MQTLRCELSRVNALWAERIEKRAVALADEISRVPIIVGGAPAVDDDGELVLRAALQGAPIESATYGVLIRHPGSPQGKNLQVFQGMLKPDAGLVFTLGDGDDAPTTIEYQFSMRWLREGVVVQHVTEWRKAQRPKAR